MKILSNTENEEEWVNCWVTFNKKHCKLKICTDEKEEDIIDEIDICGATFVYDLENSQNGELKLWYVNIINVNHMEDF